jgi:hypothetical protein
MKSCEVERTPIKAAVKLIEKVGPIAGSTFEKKNIKNKGMSMITRSLELPFAQAISFMKTAFILLKLIMIFLV